MAWSPDGNSFIQLTVEKWNYVACCIGHITDSKLDTVQSLGAVVTDRAKKFLIAEKNPEYRRHAKEMTTALYGPSMNNDGSGSIEVVFQIPKEIDTRAVRVRFRLPMKSNPSRIEVIGAAYVPKSS